MTRPDPEYGLRLGDFVIGARLGFRRRHGYWCRHPYWSQGVLVDLGRRKLSRCLTCGYGRLT